MFRSGIRLVQLAAAAGLAAIALAPAAAQAAPAPAANGGWAVQSVPVPQAHISLFGSVSCAKPGDCVAVGAVKRLKQNADVLIETSKNGVWSIANAPQPGNGGPSVLRSVSCPVTGFCVAVGHTSFAGGGIAPVSEIWNGTTWRMGGAGGGNAILNSVSCSSAKSCVAVGATVERISKNGINTAITHPLIERWNGSGWSVSGGAALASRGQLSSVSCVSADFCMALGTAKLNGSDTFPIAEHWNGVSWHVMTALGLNRNQTSVSCSSSAWCMTAGTSQHGAHMAVAQRWNGHTWKTFALGQPGILHGVSCTSNSACTAVGSSGRGSYAASWNGAGWNLAALPAGNHWTSTALTSVDCTSAVNCAAAGSATKNGLQIPAAEVRS
jgi:hypothetical protein